MGRSKNAGAMSRFSPAEKVSWDSFRTKSLIVEYKKFDHLYNTQHELYRNKKTREETLGRIANTLNVAWYGSGFTCTIDDIKKKLNGLRSQYLFERQKISRAAAQGGVYNPTIYWYPMLKFLEPVTLNGPQRVSTTDASILEYVFAQMPTSDDSGDVKINMSEPRHVEDDDLSSNGDPPSIASSTSTQESFVDVQSYLQCEKANASNSKRKADTNDPLFLPDVKRNKSNSNTPSSSGSASCFNMKQERLTKSELADHLETFGKFVANELRGISLSSNDVFLRRTKRQLQQVLIDAWTFIDMDESRYPGSSVEDKR